MDNRIPLSWAIARGRDALKDPNPFRTEEEMEQDQTAAMYLDKWLIREWERTKSKRKKHHDPD